MDSKDTHDDMGTQLGHVFGRHRGTEEDLKISRTQDDHPPDTPDAKEFKEEPYTAEGKLSKWVKKMKETRNPK